MKALWMTNHRGTKGLEIRETADPEPKPHEVRLRVQASGLNFSDLAAHKGLYALAPRPPCVLGYEAAGMVDKLGAEASGFRVGDSVVGLLDFGGHSDVVCVPSSNVLRLPEGMSPLIAAALPVNYLTAQYMLSRVAHVSPGETVLVHGAAGGVGLALLQLCRAIGDVRVIGTASKVKHDVLRKYGCEHAIDYTSESYVQEVRRITKGDGVDVVFDALGGADWARGYQLLRSRGRLVAYGFNNAVSGESKNLWRIAGQFLRMPRFSPLKLMTDNRIVAGVTLKDIWGEPLLPLLSELFQLHARGVIEPVVDSTFSLESAVEGYRRLQQRKNVGKILLQMDAGVRAEVQS